MLLVLISLLLILITLIYIYFGIKFNHWKNKGVEQLPDIPIISPLYRVLAAEEHFSQYFIKLYNICKGKNLPYIGYYAGFSPVLFIRDTELIKNILVKNFANFTDHAALVHRQADPYGARNLFSMTGERWKEMRSKLTPTFTSGRMKLMFPLVLECSKKLEIYLQNEINKNNNNDDIQDLDLRDILSRYTTDVIGSCVFGIKSDSINDPNSKFREMGKEIFSNNHTNFEKLLARVAPKLAQLIGIKAYKREVVDFFINLVEQTVKMREKEKRNDFMQLLIEIKKYGQVIDETIEDNRKTSQEWTDDDITAQTLVFFNAGYETSALTLTYALFELSRRPDLQIKAREHIEEVLNCHNGEISYQSLQEMTYLDFIIQETLRKYPPLGVLFRVCNKEYTIPNTDITIEKDTTIMIPMQAMQNDPDYFPEPEMFIPERYENNQTPYTYMPFGEGPRQCIGLRFAKMQTKVGLVTLLRNFDIKPSSNIKINYPVKIDPKQLFLSPEEKIFVNISKKDD